MVVYLSFQMLNFSNLAYMVDCRDQRGGLYHRFSEALSRIGSHFWVDEVIKRTCREIDDFDAFSTISHFE